ncbi:hypothetical protein WB44_01970 [Synechococcus sp. WH 8020]|uniref:hypothetical protein n=1 Tax=unclassified Synechococcus TaxID=2626047 RepID=UPI000652733B|nr:hypothetical protein [Synechococcus sp. WH 8020]AKN60088.1 hypothetical protein WB44_01970 [Synechococcus sp. WH 8020]
MSTFLCRFLTVVIMTASAAPVLAFEPLQKSFDATAQDASSEVIVEDMNFSSDDLGEAESLTVTPAAPGERGRAPKGYSLLNMGL